MSNRSKLKSLIMDTFLLDESEFRFDLSRSEVGSWDSLGVVTIAIGVEEVFGYHFTPDEASRLRGVADIIAVLTEKGISFDE
ncbi:MAG: acyl carrier protein [Deltaproteobacteria bacterium]|nr:acyl carrier protein [Deltaproteobacteria bacterium]